LWCRYPFPTALVAEHLRDGTSASKHWPRRLRGHVPPDGLTFFLSYVYAGRKRLLPDDMTPQQVQALLRRNARG